MIDPPNIDLDRVATAVSEQFGLVGQLESLVSERDQNLSLRTPDGRRFVVKITGRNEDPVVTDFQILALVHLQELGTEGVPQVVRTTRGEDRGTICNDDGTETCLRVVTWLGGRMLNDITISTEISRSFGRRLAGLDYSLAGFSHPGDQQILIWDAQRALELRPLLVHVDDADIRQQIDEVFDDLQDSVLRALELLPKQVIHNDANPENVLLDDEGDVSGIIDFGDMLRAPRVVDVATAASYLRTTAGDPLEFIAPFVAGYHTTSPLQKEELDLLYDLIRTRLAMTLSILYWRLSTREPGDPYREKTLASEASAIEFLRRLSAMGREEATRRLCEMIAR